MFVQAVCVGQARHRSRSITVLCCPLHFSESFQRLSVTKSIGIHSVGTAFFFLIESSLYVTVYCTNISLLLGPLNRFWIYPLSDSSGTTTPAFLKAPLPTPHNREKFDKKQLKVHFIGVCVSDYALYSRIDCAINETLI